MDVLRTGGIGMYKKQKAIEHMFTRKDGTQMTYAEMRSYILNIILATYVCA